MTPEQEFSQATFVRTKRKRTFIVSSAVKLTRYFIKKFSAIIITEDDTDSCPSKKRKIATENENTDANVISKVITDKSSYLVLNKKKVTKNVLTEKIPPLHATASRTRNLPRPIRIRRKPLKDTEIFVRKSLAVQSTAFIKRSPSVTYTHSLTSHQNLFNQFKNCANFVRVSRLQNITDIASIVSTFSSFGKISNIQDHWIRPTVMKNKYSSLWMGATVTYRYEEDLNRALKAFSIEKSPVICVSIVQHLSRISLVESEYNEQNIDTKFKGSTIIVENIFARSSREKLQAAFESYGNVSNVRWLRKKDSVRSCEVTYQSTTNAVAAALALDGKTVHRSILRVQIKMTTKEIFIHNKLCEMF